MSYTQTVLPWWKDPRPSGAASAAARSAQSPSQQSQPAERQPTERTTARMFWRVWHNAEAGCVRRDQDTLPPIKLTVNSLRCEHCPAAVQWPSSSRYSAVMLGSACPTPRSRNAGSLPRPARPRPMLPAAGHPPLPGLHRRELGQDALPAFTVHTLGRGRATPHQTRPSVRWFAPFPQRWRWLTSPLCYLGKWFLVNPVGYGTVVGTLGHQLALLARRNQPYPRQPRGNGCGQPDGDQK